MENIIHQLEKWFLRNQPTSECEFHFQTGISEDLIYKMRSLTSMDLLTRVDLEV
jgi:hypothetical protein